MAPAPPHKTESARAGGGRWQPGPGLQEELPPTARAGDPGRAPGPAARRALMVVAPRARDRRIARRPVGGPVRKLPLDHVGVRERGDGVRAAREARLRRPRARGLLPGDLRGRGEVVVREPGEGVRRGGHGGGALGDGLREGWRV
eukprot:CAMPEP_0179360064 /NCGR_PEP_ID=MMETSP0797-20121207/79777_1 /TAXON_ID=47934 /ORGANISM="Dinophysis acuminata, Strain DAEP01" /LENGTH=144 /DNA_ID=CAMNT_0021075393 /DNA_START=396 /DNA_END=831 /DNA_ORIENTATION=+